MFSILQNGNRGRFTKAQWEEKMAAAKVHITFSLKLFELQRRMGNHFLYEHPRTATSWQLPEMEEFMNKTGVIEVLANMCRFGMTTKYQGEEGKVTKATRFMTSSPECAKRFGRVWDQECKKDKHIAIWGTRAREAQRYPPALCRAVVEGVKAEKMIAESNLCEIDVDHILDLAATEGIEDAETRHEGTTTTHPRCARCSHAHDDPTRFSLPRVQLDSISCKPGPLLSAPAALPVPKMLRAIVPRPANPFAKRDGHAAPQSLWAAAAYPPGDIRRYFRVLSGGPCTPPRPVR